MRALWLWAPVCVAHVDGQRPPNAGARSLRPAIARGSDGRGTATDGRSEGHRRRREGKGKGKVLGRSPNSSVSVIPTCPKAQHPTAHTRYWYVPTFVHPFHLGTRGCYAHVPWFATPFSKATGRCRAVLVPQTVAARRARAGAVGGRAIDHVAHPPRLRGGRGQSRTPCPEGTDRGVRGLGARERPPRPPFRGGSAAPVRRSGPFAWGGVPWPPEPHDVCQFQ